MAALILHASAINAHTIPHLTVAASSRAIDQVKLAQFKMFRHTHLRCIYFVHTKFLNRHKLPLWVFANPPCFEEQWNKIFTQQAAATYVQKRTASAIQTEEQVGEELYTIKILATNV